MSSLEATALKFQPRPSPLPVAGASGATVTVHRWHLGRRRQVAVFFTADPRFLLPQSRRIGPVCSMGTDRDANNSTVRLTAVVGEGSVSPLKSATWEEVMLHTADRLKWVDGGYEMRVLTDECLPGNNSNTEHLQSELGQTDLLVVVAVTKHAAVEWLQKNSHLVENIICFDSSTIIQNKLGGHVVHTEVKGNMFSRALGSPKKTGESLEVLGTVSDAWKRNNSDDIRFCLLVIINAYIKPVTMLKNLRSKGFSTLSCMIKNCGSQVLNCLLDPNCRKALQCLNNCSPTDQVCSYRCIATYESPRLEAFSLCVLEKHNCLALDAEISKNPYVPPLAMFRGDILTHDIAEDLFIGWLGPLEWSWRVVAGQNPAYDQFPCQYQLFYRGKARGSFWYEPVFQIKTLEGEIIWRRRRYRVKRSRAPGTFYFTVLDNGVVSKEFWTIVDVADDLSWGLFHYSGAARAAGQSYVGAVLVSPDGKYPAGMGGAKLASALEKCGIKEWELFTVDNCSCSNAPLGIPDGSRLHNMVEVLLGENERYHAK